MESTAASFKCYVLEIDESTDVVDMAQLAIFITDTNSEYDVTEEMGSLVFLVPGKDTTKSLFVEAVKITLY